AIQYRKDVLRYCIAGHPRPIIYRSQQGEFETLESNGGIAGVIPESYYRGQVVRLNINDVTVLFTDGIIEARSARGFFGEHRLKAIVESSREETAQKIADQIFAGVSRFTSNNLNDDAAVVVLKKIS
ncbi:MAG TPA: serine/threonine-protein phosphatase, partial [Actinobacteria bacterium]|nr:serine/threonine-protein phosphatase [Actinomycetota bacterium]